ncbi:MAG: GNAT family N-acetyltransferase [Hyphomicrobiaceae bacterium]|nr:GNAT family N-acetyltransferase [Hyphomicrobiaceae bacterium]MCC0023590.1 GNAT family N-acetyltransferase [Hyphomicrobiaceae bacterium]
MNSSAVHIRISGARVEEIRRLAGIAYDAWCADILPLVGDQPGLRMREYARFRQFVDQNIRRIIVAREGERPVGWIGRGKSPNYVAFLFVAPEVQRQGIGSLLLSRLESLAMLEGQTHLWLDTFAELKSATGFYRRHGYRPILPQNRRAKPPTDASSVRLAKPLTILQNTPIRSGKKT